MKYIKRIASFIMALTMLLSAAMPMRVSAATEGTTTVIDTEYRCYKGSNTGTKGTAPLGNKNYYWHYNADGTALNSPIRFMKEKGTNTPVYCIEVGATFGGGYSYSTKALEDSPYWNKLSATAQAGITYTTMYGYPTNTYGAAYCDAYAATQTIIWEFAKGYRNLSGRTNNYFYDLMIKGSPAENAYNQLAAAVANHNKRPSFSYTTTGSASSSPVTLRYSGGTWSASLNDSNGVLGGYNVTSNGGLTVSKNGNTMTISTNKELTSPATITLGRPTPTGQALLALYSTSSQNAIVGQLKDPVSSFLAVQTEAVAGKVSVVKTDEAGNKLAGVVFGIYSDRACSNLITSMTTGSDGSAVSGDLNVNSYPVVYVKEISMTDAQSGKMKLNTTVYETTLKSAQTVAVNGGKPVVNEWKDGKVSIKKQDKTGKPLKGVVFTVFSDSACTQAVTTITTDENGSAVSGDIDVGTAGERTVYVLETSLPDELKGSYNISAIVYTVTVKAGETTATNDNKPVVNEWKKGKVSAVKQNEAGEGLESVVFGVFTDSDCTQQLMTFSTGVDGLGISADIDVGNDGRKTVYVKELSMTYAQQNYYSLNSTVYPVTVTAGKIVQANDGKPVVNKWLPGKISVIKTNPDGKPLLGAEFTAYADESCTEVIKDLAGNPVVLTTGENGKAESSEIYVGKAGSRTIYVKETAFENPAADILSMNTTVYQVTIKANVTSKVNDGKPVVNNYKPGKVKVVKENENGNRLAGIIFTVYSDKACRDKITTVVTDENGEGISEDIEISTEGERVVYVKETKIPDENQPFYQLSATVYETTIFSNQTVQVNNGKTVINHWTPGQISVVKVNENGDSLEGVTFGIYEDPACLMPLRGADSKPVTMTTGEDGSALSGDIEVGRNGSRKLFVKEISMNGILADSYVMNGTIYPVVVSAGTVSPINDGNAVVNEWQPSRFELYKIKMSEAPVKGAEFTAFNDVSCTDVIADVEGGAVVVVTDEDGYAESTEIKVNADGKRTIYVKETAVADPTVVINDKVFTITLEAGKNIAANNGDSIFDDWKPGKVEVVKHNEAGEALAGVTFGVFDDKDCTMPTKDVSDNDVVLVTDENGHAVSEDIRVNSSGKRTVYVRELSMTDEQTEVYELNTNVFVVTIKANDVTTANGGNAIINDWKPATFSLVKIDEDKNVLSGVTFAAFEDEDCTVPVKDVSGTDVVLVTDENGCASSGEIKVNAEGSRTIYVREISMTVSDSDIYELSEKVYVVELSAGKNTEINGGEPVVNDFKTVPVKIRKSDLTTAEGVPGAEIVIYSADGTEIYRGITKEDGETEEIELRVGKYTFVETVAPDGYVLNKTVFEFSINPDGTVTGDLTVTDKPTEWKITKTDLTTGQPLPGAEITIYDSEGNVVFKDITGEDGTVTAFYLSAGTYTFKETAAPEGYVVNEESFTFTIDEEGNATGDNNITDKRIYGNIRVIKVGDDGSHLAGATFGLFSENGKTELARKVTGEDGSVTFSNIEYGKYVIKELEAPVGFLMKETEFKVEINEDGKTVELTVSNSREPVFPKTADSGFRIFLFIALAALSAAVLITMLITKLKNHDFNIFRR